MTTTPYAKITRADIERKGWKYVGYGGFSKFVASDEDFLVFRRFDHFHTRIILSLQDQISLLAAELEEQDLMASSKSEPDRHNGTFRNESMIRRSQILAEGQDLLLRYDELLLKYGQLRKPPRASTRNVSSIENWLYNNGDPIEPMEKLYLEHDRDLIPVVPKIKSSLRLFLERYNGFRLSSLWALRYTELEQDDRLDNADVHYASDERIEYFISLLILSFGTVMLIAPLWILNSTQSPTKRLREITAFIIFFLGFLAITTNARPFESVAAAAAYAPTPFFAYNIHVLTAVSYSAVLMVFMQISSNNT